MNNKYKNIFSDLYQLFNLDIEIPTRLNIKYKYTDLHKMYIV